MRAYVLCLSILLSSLNFPLLAQSRDFYGGYEIRGGVVPVSIYLDIFADDRRWDTDSMRANRERWERQVEARERHQRNIEAQEARMRAAEAVMAAQERRMERERLRREEEERYRRQMERERRQREEEQRRIEQARERKRQRQEAARREQEEYQRQQAEFQRKERERLQREQQLREQRETLERNLRQAREQRTRMEEEHRRQRQREIDRNLTLEEIAREERRRQEEIDQHDARLRANETSYTEFQEYEEDTLERIRLDHENDLTVLNNAGERFSRRREIMENEIRDDERTIEEIRDEARVKSILMIGENIYSGESVFGDRDGFGVLKSQEYEYSGQWRNDQFEGHGVLKIGSLTTEGQFSEGKAHGKADQYVGTDLVYTGGFEEGQRSGQGIKYFPRNSDFDSYSGSFDNGQENGHGLLYSRNGQIHSGSFVDGVPDGPATITNPNGDLERGVFKDGFRDGVFYKISSEGELSFETYEDGIQVENDPVVVNSLKTRFEDLESLEKTFKDYQFISPDSSLKEEIVGTYKNILEVDSKVKKAGLIRSIGLAMGIQADRNLSQGQIEEAKQVQKIANEALNVLLDQIPITARIKEVVEAVTGYNYITNKKLSTAERALAILSFATLGMTKYAKWTMPLLKRVASFLKLDRINILAKPLANFLLEQDNFLKEIPLLFEKLKQLNWLHPQDSNAVLDFLFETEIFKRAGRVLEYLTGKVQAIGPKLPVDAIKKFKQGVYFNRKLNADEVFYYYKGINSRTGEKFSFITKKKYTSMLNLKFGLGKFADGVDVVNMRSRVKVPAGTWVSEGLTETSSRFQHVTNGGHYGAVIDDIPDSWIENTRRIFQ